MTKHTPGPWAVLPDEDKEHPGEQPRIYSSLADRKNCTLVAVVGNAEHWTDALERWEANAKLIAVAPDLLEALCDVTEFADALRKERAQGGSMEDVRRIEAARAAIAKATA